MEQPFAHNQHVIQAEVWHIPLQMLCHGAALICQCASLHTARSSLAAHLTLSLCIMMSAVSREHPVSSAGLNSGVAGRTPDVVLIPLPGVVYSSPTAKLKKVSEHGGLMKVYIAEGYPM